MNLNTSMTDKTERLKDHNSLAGQWKTLDWKKIEKEVNRLQTRITKATIKGDWNKVKRLQYLLTNSFCAKAYAVKKVTSYRGKLFSTINGTSQGGHISSLYANLTLDGLEALIQDRYHQNSKGNIEGHYRAKTKVNFIRYCDDFIVTAATREIAEEVKILISNFLKERGLELSDEKTLKKLSKLSYGVISLPFS